MTKTLSWNNINEMFSPTASWYIIVLDDDWNDPFRDELRKNLGTFSEKVGPQIWVIQGHSPQRDEFFSAIFHRYRLYLGDYSFESFPRPALLVTNIVPPAGGIANEEFNDIIRIIFPLADRYVKAGSISDFLRNLSLTLQKPDALETLRSLNERSFMDTWGWILDCFEIKPSFLGIVNFNVGEFIRNINRK